MHIKQTLRSSLTDPGRQAVQPRAARDHFQVSGFLNDGQGEWSRALRFAPLAATKNKELKS